MPPVEPSAQVTALLRGCEVTEGATQAVGPAGEAEGDGGCRERAEGDVTMGASGDSVAGKAGDASVEGPVLEW